MSKHDAGVIGNAHLWQFWHSWQFWQSYGSLGYGAHPELCGGTEQSVSLPRPAGVDPIACTTEMPDSSQRASNELHSRRRRTMSTQEQLIQMPEERERDLGFGSSLSQRTNFRLLNRDGSFNVRRSEPSLWSSLYSYNALITMPWWKFFLDVVGVYLLVNSIFAVAFVLCGPDALHGEAGVPAF